MKKFVLIFRMDITTEELQPSGEQMKVYMAQWNEWINDMTFNGQLDAGGKHLTPDGRVIRPGNIITGGPYTAGKESVAGYIIISAKDMNDAVSIAGKCPILQGEGTSVEVREAGITGQ